MMAAMRWLPLIVCALGLGGCSTLPRQPPGSPPPLAEDFVGQTVVQRTWFPADELAFDPIRLGETIPLTPLPVHAKLLGSDEDDAVASLAAKLWLIENARHSIDLVYYIFKRDDAGYAVLGALCDAVKRGVDVRMMVDSAGSLHPTHSELRGLQSCAEQAGVLVDPESRPTTHRARAQVAIINPLSSPFVRWNRRSHDKLLVVDGHQRDRAHAMTGGRNISLDYYGLDHRGERHPGTYQDAEVLVRERESDGMGVGDAVTYYYSLLFLQPGTRLLDPPRPGSRRAAAQRDRSAAALARVRGWPRMRAALEGMPAWMGDGFVEAEVRMAHELGNLANRRAVRGIDAHLEANRNSIQRQWIEWNLKDPPRHLRIVSPYFFFAQYRFTRRGAAFDGAATLLDLLERNPGMQLELLTNSALTSDNPLTQAVIDMDTAPRLLLDREGIAAWRRRAGDRHLEALADDAAWQALMNHPRIHVYQLGRLDARALGGTQDYGKLHAKFIVADQRGFIGTDNFDYRSRLFNNEFGFFFESEALAGELVEEFESLKRRSVRWGTPEWLAMRRQIIDRGGFTGLTTRWQRGIHGVSKATGLHWLY